MEDKTYGTLVTDCGIQLIAAAVMEGKKINITDLAVGDGGGSYYKPNSTMTALSKAGKPFMVVTQMLASMEQNPVPTRAEVSDIFNAVADGAAAVMVTGETAVGKWPVEVIRYLSNTVQAAERFLREG